MEPANQQPAQPVFTLNEVAAAVRANGLAQGASGVTAYRARLLAQALVMVGGGAAAIYSSGVLQTRDLQTARIAALGTVVIIAGIYSLVADWQARTEQNALAGRFNALVGGITVSQLSEQAAKAQSDLAQREQELAAAQQEVKTKEARVQELSATASQLREKFDALQSQLESAEKQHGQQLRAAQKDFDGRLAQVTAANDKQRQELAQAAEANERRITNHMGRDLDAARAEHKRAVAEAEAKLKRFGEELSDVEVACSQLEAQNARQSQALSEKDSKMREQAERISGLTSELAAAKKETRITDRAAADLLARADELLTEKNALNDRVALLQGQLADLQRQLVQARRQPSIFHEEVPQPARKQPDQLEAAQPAAAVDPLEKGRNLLDIYLSKEVEEWKEGVILNDSEAYGAAIHYCVHLSENPSEDATVKAKQEERIRSFFRKIQAALKLPAPISTDALQLELRLGTRMKLQCILSPQLNRLHQIEFPSQDDLLAMDLAMAEIATSFGLGIVETGKGKNGAVFIKTLAGKSVGVFKATRKIHWMDWVGIIKLFMGQGKLLSKDKGARELSEVVASLLAERLGLGNMIPRAIEASFCGEGGAFIEFKRNFQELHEVVSKINDPRTFEKEEQMMWQKAVVWWFLTTNLDPHDENIFVRFVNDSNNLEEICLIDHGNILPEKRTDGGLIDKMAEGSLGKWGQYAISKCLFLPEIRQMILETITADGLTAFMDAAPRLQDGKPYFNDGMRRVLLENAEVLRECVASKGTIPTPWQLSAIKTDFDVGSALKIAGETPVTVAAAAASGAAPKLTFAKNKE